MISAIVMVVCGSAVEAKLSHDAANAGPAIRSMSATMGIVGKAQQMKRRRNNGSSTQRI
jgi:hypothetical protein